MKPDRIESHIDQRIITHFSEGLRIVEVITILKGNIESFTSRDSFIKVKKRYLINNWSLIPPKKKYTTYCVMHYTKRVNDLEWLLENRHKFSKAPFCILKNINLFNLILLKDKLSLKRNPNPINSVITPIVKEKHCEVPYKPDLEKDSVGILWKHWTLHPFPMRINT